MLMELNIYKDFDNHELSKQHRQKTPSDDKIQLYTKNKNKSK